MTMARPASQATAGYFPTPEHLLPAIGSLLAIERERYDRPLLFDPCAGTGSALLGLAAFRQVVVLAERRAEPAPPDRVTLQRLRAAADSAEALPVLPAPDDAPALPVHVSHGHLTLHPQTIDVEELLARARPFAPS